MEQITRLEQLARPIALISALLFLGACGQQPAEESTSEIQEIPAGTDTLSAADLKERLVSEGYQVFDFVDEERGDTILMQQYFMAFLKSGPVRSQNQEEADSIQRLHLAHLARMYYEGYADISGPFGDEGETRGITIYNVPTLEMADSLANMDPAVQSGRLVIEVRPWWAAKGYPLR